VSAQAIAQQEKMEAEEYDDDDDGRGQLGDVEEVEGVGA
jgi:hypothetical protein